MGLSACSGTPPGRTAAEIAAKADCRRGVAQETRASGAGARRGGAHDGSCALQHKVALQIYDDLEDLTYLVDALERFRAINSCLVPAVST